MDLSSSKLMNDAVDAFASLPGIGRKTALRLVLYLLRQEESQVNHFGETLLRLKKDIRFCRQCHHIAEKELCQFCSNYSRDHSVICVVEDIKDVLAIENTHQFRGVYHVLGGRISPMEGIGPSDLHIESLLERVAQGGVQEIILAMSSTMEGDTTNFYLFKKLSGYPIQVTTIARGIGFGDELEYADEMTLGRSILHRIPYEKTLVNK
ncbi:MAG: recombination mediator RecR [Flavobacteriales bacterium]|nr:recombination mediator RecR [Flavobacteriales bacterium]